MTMPEETTWGSVNPGDIIEGSNNSLWSVKARPIDGSTTVVNVLTGKEITSSPPNDKPVVVVTRAQHVLHQARAITQVKLGATDVTFKNATGEWVCPVEYAHPGTLATHLMIFHGVFGSAVAGRPLNEMEALHVTIHEPSNRAGGYEPHVHDPAYEKLVTASDKTEGMASTV